MDFRKLFLHSSLLVLHFAFSSSKDTITINQTIHDGDFLISRENNFALGFFSPGSSRFRYLGIWFRKVREQTVVWVANRDDPINGSSGVLSIDQYGNLVLHSYHNLKVPVWSTNVSVEATDTCVVAQLLDTGNLVLFDDRSKSTVWESFDHPTDTMLPGMKLGLDRRTGMNRFLISWRSAADPELETSHFRSTQKDHHRSLSTGVQNIFGEAFLGPGKVMHIYSMLVLSTIKMRHMRHTLFLMLRYPKSTPRSPCDPYGHCGTYGICDPEFLSRRFECDCLPGYEPKSPRDWHILKDASGGCVRKRLESTSLCGHGEGFVKVANVKVPDTSAAVWGRGKYIYVRVDAVELAEIAEKWNGFLKRKDMLAILVISVVSAWFVIILFTYLWLKKKKKRVRNKWNKRWLDTIGTVENQVEGSMSHPEIAFFNLSTILAATNSFSPANKLGQGGFGVVYKGKLSNGKEVAVKRLSKDSGQGIDEFKNEVLLIAKLQHQNLVKLLGCCIQGEEPMLVYEYMPNKSLDSFLFNETRRSILDWRKRFDIIVGIARGILYIHQDSRLKIIHRDLKTSNILLDEEMNPKISDFGLARIFKGDQTHEKTNRIVGTFGYMSPEYVVFGKFSTKSDVFSFGIILLEIITGKRNNSFYQEDFYPSMIGKFPDFSGKPPEI
ncbi:hypothetical protein GH714_020958 [Hevea brasiliensis]|uniref:Receptor-like serine/threonine-protein kinase n=2 Tax=Hevea brasiliensis TaxID=3981 RepID=A0A6A6MY99_HEVBR|nr:hypothetical protein GH714_020958 [Hevea brasiliensis]